MKIECNNYLIFFLHFELKEIPIDIRLTVKRM